MSIRHNRAYKSPIHQPAALRSSVSLHWAKFERQQHIFSTRIFQLLLQIVFLFVEHISIAPQRIIFNNWMALSFVCSGCMLALSHSQTRRHKRSVIIYIYINRKCELLCWVNNNMSHHHHRQSRYRSHNRQSFVVIVDSEANIRIHCVFVEVNRW